MASYPGTISPEEKFYSGVNGETSVVEPSFCEHTYCEGTSVDDSCEISCEQESDEIGLVGVLVENLKPM